MPNQSRENRIYNEIIVDCHDEYEQQSGWYCYMEDQLHFPFKATITLKKRGGAKKEQSVDVLCLLSGDEEPGNDMRVEVSYSEDIFDVPLLSLKNIKADDETVEAIEDWGFWKNRK